MIGKYREKPVVIEAVCYLEGTDAFDIATWILENRGAATFPTNGAPIVIKTLEGEMEARLGDWIIKGVMNEFYPCKPDIFAATYEPA
jgi:hypothetical protein